MKNKNKYSNAYDDGNIPEIDLPQDKTTDKTDYENVEPLLSMIFYIILSLVFNDFY